MNEFLEIALRSFWSFCGVVILMWLVLQGIGTIMLNLWNRFWRHLNIRKHGYPPAHCDADGDFLNKQKDNS